MGRLKSIVLKIILILGSCIFSLLILEMGVRIFVPVIKPRIIVEKGSPLQVERKLKYGEPFFEGVFLSAEYTTQIKTNSEGFRDIEHELNKPKGVFRILVAGDSFTFGLGVEANQTYPKLLEEVLNEKNKNKEMRYEIFNMGIAGIGTLEELEIIKYGIRYKPDLVLLGLFVENRWNPGNGNDLCDNLKSWYKSKDKKIIEGGFSGISLRLRSKVVDCLNSFQRFLAKNSDLYFLLMTRKGTFLRTHLIKFRENQNQYELGISWDITKDTLKEINTFMQKEGVPFVIVRIPFLYDVHSQDVEVASEILLKFGKENNINIYDLLDDFRKNKDNDLYYPADGHWKPLAHKLAASEINNYLVNNNFISVK